MLTRWITHVNHAAIPLVTLNFDQHPPSRLVRIPSSPELDQSRIPYPGVSMISPSRVLLTVTPATRSIAAKGVAAANLSCRSVDVSQTGVTALLANEGIGGVSAPVAVERRGDDVFIPISPQLSRAVARTPSGIGAIVCQFSRPVSATPTFTERAITIKTNTRSAGAVLFDVSALEDVDDVRFSGGLQLPYGGDRVRILYGGNDVIAVEWADVGAQERRDIVLVIIGALSAIAAATVIEAIRPVVESRSPD